MCGRFIFYGDSSLVRQAFGVSAEKDDLIWPTSSANIAPSQLAAAVVTGSEGRPKVLPLRFGWPHPRGGSGLLINARLETVARLPTFRRLWETHRCVVPANGFYEWADGPPPRQPWAFRRDDGYPFGLAGIWQPSPLPGAPNGAMVLLTEMATGAVAEVHGRMPVMLEAQASADYLRGTPPQPDALKRLSPVALACEKVLPGVLATTSPRGRLRAGPVH